MRNPVVEILVVLSSGLGLLGAAPVETLPQVLRLQPCEIRLTGAGQAANFRGIVRFDAETDEHGTPVKISVPAGQTLALFLETERVSACIARWSLAPRTKYEIRVRFGTHDIEEEWSVSLVNANCPTITIPAMAGNGRP